jgi:FdhD protein
VSSTSARPGSTARVSVERVALETGGAARRRRSDRLTTEEPLEIRVSAGGGPAQPLTVTMRTPGADFELVAGLLHAEGVVDEAGEILSLRYCVEGLQPQNFNVISVAIPESAAPRLERLRRSLFSGSGCGVCGKVSIDQVRLTAPPVPVGRRIAAALLGQLPERLRGAQPLFERTGGLHAAALFSAEGELLAVREDVGRHNALDKLVGASLLGDPLPFAEGVVLVSGRLGFELAQKATRAGIPLLAAVGAPSSLAVEMAAESGMTVVGFLRESGFNIYSHPERVT